MASMTIEERGATESFLDSLREQWKRVVRVQKVAANVLNAELYNETAKELAQLYSEIKEAEFALFSGTLPF